MDRVGDRAPARDKYFQTQFLNGSKYFRRNHLNGSYNF